MFPRKAIRKMIFRVCRIGAPIGPTPTARAVLAELPAHGDQAREKRPRALQSQINKAVPIRGPKTAKAATALVVPARRAPSKEVSAFFPGPNSSPRWSREDERPGLAGCRKPHARRSLISKRAGPSFDWPNGRPIIFHVLTKLFERIRIAISNSLSLSKWATAFHNAKMAAARLDRLDRRCHLDKAGANSVRIRTTKARLKERRISDSESPERASTAVRGVTEGESFPPGLLSELATLGSRACIFAGDSDGRCRLFVP